MRTNTLKAKIEAGQTCYGVFVPLSAPSLVEAVGLLGFDFVVVDAEHGPLSEETVENLVRAADAVNLPAIVRVPQNVPQVILRYTDSGACGIQVPQIQTAVDVAAAAKALRYYPMGSRGLAGVRWSDYGLAEPLPKQVERANRELSLVVQIETAESVKHLPQILAVPDVDIFFIGPTDLSQALGMPGQPLHPTVVETIDRIVEQIRAADKVAGVMTYNLELIRHFADSGVQFITVGAMTLFARGGREFLKVAWGS